MSDTENGAMAMAGPNQLVEVCNGIAGYVPLFRRLEVAWLPGGARLVRAREGDAEIVFRLDAKACGHLVKLLGAGAAAEVRDAD